MKKLVSALVFSLAILAMLLPVMNDVNQGISNATGTGVVLTADGGPNPPPIPPNKPPANA
jgi:hypothetical protein